MTTHEIVKRCRDRGCDITWALSTVDADGEDNGYHIEVDHHTKTLTGSMVYVTRDFPGDCVRQGQAWDWTSEQASAVSAWVEQLHRMPLEEIP